MAIKKVCRIQRRSYAAIDVNGDVNHDANAYEGRKGGASIKLVRRGF